MLRAVAMMTIEQQIEELRNKWSELANMSEDLAKVEGFLGEGYRLQAAVLRRCIGELCAIQDAAQHKGV